MGGWYEIRVVAGGWCCNRSCGLGHATCICWPASSNLPWDTTDRARELGSRRSTAFLGRPTKASDISHREVLHRIPVHVGGGGPADTNGQLASAAGGRRTGEVNLSPPRAPDLPVLRILTSLSTAVSAVGGQRPAQMVVLKGRSLVKQVPVVKRTAHLGRSIPMAQGIRGTSLVPQPHRIPDCFNFKGGAE